VLLLCGFVCLGLVGYCSWRLVVILVYGLLVDGVGGYDGARCVGIVVGV